MTTLEKALSETYLPKKDMSELKEEPLWLKEELVYDKYVSEYIKQKPEMDDFSDIYPKEEIKEDKDKLTEIKERRKFKKTKRSEILEAVLARQIEEANWLGENCFISQVCEYDDVINHTDLVAEFRERDEILRLAIDITTTEKTEDLEKKIEKIEKEIDSGRLTSLKYCLFEETEPYYKGKIKMLPRVIIGTNKDGVKELSELVGKTIQGEKGSQKDLANFYAQIEFLEEIETQLKYFIDYAEVKKGYSPEDLLVKQHEKVLDIISEILENKKRSLGELPPRARTSVIYNYLTGLSLARPSPF